MSKEHNFQRSSIRLLFFLLLLFVGEFSLIMFIFYSSFIFGIPLTAKYSIFQFIMIMLIIFCPMFFISKIKKYFNKKEGVEFLDDGIKVVEYDAKQNMAINKYTIMWNEIKGFQYYYAYTSKYHSIVLLLKNGKKRTFSFKDMPTVVDEINNRDSIFREFYECIKRYNTEQNNYDKIILDKGFYNAPTGKIVIYISTCLILFAIILTLITKSHPAIMILSFAFIFTLQLFRAKNQEMKTYKILTELDNKQTI